MRMKTNLFEVLRSVGPRPREASPLGMRHNSSVSAVSRAKTSNSISRSVGVEGVGLCGLSRVIHIADGSQVLFLDFLKNSFIREVSSSFTVRRPATQHRTFHSLEENGGISLFNSQSGKARFKSPRFIMKETRFPAKKKN